MRSKLLGSVSTHFLRLPLDMSWVYAIMGPELRVDGHRCGVVTNLLIIVLRINKIYELLDLQLSLKFVTSDLSKSHVLLTFAYDRRHF
jgi:hypothetical protein